MSTTIHDDPSTTQVKSAAPKAGKTSKNGMGDRLEASRQAVSDTARAANDMAAETADGARDSVAVATDNARTMAKEQPLMAVAGAMAIGVALGFALGNRRS